MKGVAVLVLILVALAIVAYAVLRPRGSGPGSGASQRLLARLGDDRKYRIYVGTPLAAPTTWSEASRVSGDQLLVDGSTIEVSNVRSFVVAYLGGEMIDHVGPPHHLPQGIHGLSPQGNETDIVVLDAELAKGRKFVRVEYGKSRARPSRREHYSTTVRNVSDQPVRVLKFGAFERDPGGVWTLYTATGEVYSAAQFREWYGQTGEWLQPGEAATDPNNYGGPGLLWAYFFETREGTTLSPARLDHSATGVLPARWFAQALHMRLPLRPGELASGDSNAWPCDSGAAPREATETVSVRRGLRSPSVDSCAGRSHRRTARPDAPRRLRSDQAGCG